MNPAATLQELEEALEDKVEVPSLLKLPPTLGDGTAVEISMDGASAFVNRTQLSRRICGAAGIEFGSVQLGLVLLQRLGGC